MSEIEVPIEAIQENIHHAAHHASDDERTFMNTAAILAALLAAAAAVAALFAGHLANEALLEQIQASDKWAYYQSKGIKASIAELKSISGAEGAKGADIYREEQGEIQKEAKELERESHQHLLRHESLAASVTFFQIAIAITAIAVLTRKKILFIGSMGLGLGGLAWALKGFLF
jgi:hypothetical protein